MKKRPWTPAEDAVLRALAHTMPRASLAQLIGRTLGAVQVRIGQLGFSHPPGSDPNRRAAASRMNDRTAAGKNPVLVRWRDNALSLRYGLPPMSLPALRIVLALASGPLTRRQLCDRLGYPWKGSKSLRAHGNNSHTANLIRMGLVLQQKFFVSGGRARVGQKPSLYLLTPHAMNLLAAAGKETSHVAT